MKNYGIYSVETLLSQLLPPHKRLPNWRAFVGALLDLEPAMVAFNDFADEQAELSNMSSQIGLLEGWLKAKFGTSLHIVNNEASYVMIGLEGEGQLLDVSLSEEEGEGETLAGFPLDCESAAGGDFTLQVNSSYDIDAVVAEVNRYKLVDKTFNIVTLQ